MGAAELNGAGVGAELGGAAFGAMATEASPSNIVAGALEGSLGNPAAAIAGAAKFDAGAAANGSDATYAAIRSAFPDYAGPLPVQPPESGEPVVSKSAAPEPLVGVNGAKIESAGQPLDAAKLADGQPPTDSPATGDGAAVDQSPSKADSSDKDENADDTVNKRLRTASEIAMDRIKPEPASADATGDPSADAATTGAAKPPADTEDPATAEMQRIKGFQSAREGATPATATDAKDGSTPDAVTQTPDVQTTPATAEQNAQRQQRTQDIEEKIRNKTATAEEIKELRDLKQDPEQARAQLEQKALDGTISDEEAQRLEGMYKQEQGIAQTPEQQLEKMRTQVDDLGTKMMQDMAEGRGVSAEDLEKLRQLRSQESLMAQGASEGDAKRAVQEAFRGKNRNGSERQNLLQREMQTKIQELMALEIQILSIPKTVDALRAQRNQLQAAAKAKDSDVKSARTPEEQMKKKSEQYGMYMQVANVKAEILRVKYRMPVLKAQQKDMSQYIRRRLGVTHGITSWIEQIDAKVNLVYANSIANVQEDMATIIGDE